MLNVSIVMKQEKCPNCGGPLNTAVGVIVCAFCQTEFQPETSPQYQVPIALPDSHAACGLGLVSVGDQRYLVHGRLARGARCDVFLARRDGPLTEMVILKVARESEERHVMQEWEILAQLHQHFAGDFLEALLPQPVGVGVGRCDGHADRPASVYRWRSGFHFTFADARAEYPAGVDGRSCVWMWNRLLEQLSSLHVMGYVHGAVTPDHLLLHPRDHGLVLCGWSRCTRGWSQGTASPRDDLVGSAQCIGYLLGTQAPRPLTDLVQRAARMTCALEFKAELKRLAEKVFGPPLFHPFILSGNHTRNP